MPIIDITLTLSEALAPWPGDEPFSLRDTARMVDGSSVNLTALTMSPHTGTHVDAPRHYWDPGTDAASLPLTALIGPCHVLSVDPDPARGPIEWSEVEEQLPGIFCGVEALRLLIRTGYKRQKGTFNTHFRAPSAPFIHQLAAHNGILLGTDAPSVDAFESKDLSTHHACRTAGIVILENLVLPPTLHGGYELLALPLSIEGGDAAPVRAVLRKPDSTP